MIDYMLELKYQPRQDCNWVHAWKSINSYQVSNSSHILPQKFINSDQVSNSGQILPQRFQIVVRSQIVAMY